MSDIIATTRVASVSAGPVVAVLALITLLAVAAVFALSFAIYVRNRR